MLSSVSKRSSYCNHQGAPPSAAVWFVWSFFYVPLSLNFKIESKLHEQS